jgi:hypothetical protein
MIAPINQIIANIKQYIFSLISSQAKLTAIKILAIINSDQ